MKKIIIACIAAAMLAGNATAQSITKKGPEPKEKDVEKISFRNVARNMNSEWYKTADAARVADSVLAYQFPSGGWAKNQNWHWTPDAKKAKERANIKRLIKSKEGIGATIDNMSTTIEILYLTKMYGATGKSKYRKAALKGINYLWNAQYANGGWPQYFPLKKAQKDGTPDYSAHITYNDDAMVNVMKLMRDLAKGTKAPYDVLKLNKKELAKAQQAFDKGLQCILNTQIRKNGKLTVWCQQHHFETLEPVGARKYERPSFSGSHETADIVELLMGISNPSNEVIASVEAAVDWLRKHRIEDMRLKQFKNAKGEFDRQLVAEKGAPHLWARYYDLETEKPFYMDRRGIKLDNYNDLEHERRTGYSYIDGDVQDVLDKYPLWITKVRPGNYQEGDHWLFCHMSERGEFTAYAISKDGVNYHDLIDGDPVIDPAKHARIEKGQRDAFICRKGDGKGYVMVTTDMKVAVSKIWDNYGMDLMRSDDLINWESVTFDFRKGPSIFCDPESPNVYKDWSTINRVWAPQIFWDASYKWPDGTKGGYMIYYSMLNRAEEKYDRMYYSYADQSFTKMTKPQPLFDWGYATIDADINYVPADGLYHMMIKKEGGKTGLFTATSKNLTGPWGEPVEDDYVSFEGKKKCEGVSAFQLVGDSTWRIGYIEYSSKPKNYRICEADQYMRNFKNPQNIRGVKHPQHGSFMRITKEEYDMLQNWSDVKMKNSNRQKR